MQYQPHDILSPNKTRHTFGKPEGYATFSKKEVRLVAERIVRASQRNRRWTGLTNLDFLLEELPGSSPKLPSAVLAEMVSTGYLKRVSGGDFGLTDKAIEELAEKYPARSDL